mmetsp:Transcript_42169/g.84653  ORF Transcript_42169/g.84653 Transcript_42169/m.84653 type:complete len:154 (-) Transcript_42169:64-525(-)|eukprot:CAMPEP_0174708474 /NCGR_PEP_ID=MMETSP1094-20130205/10726_1 /TAXON_ID=156173 /ORGANISM="Chrysochromulina brevifilum, Strain UTEX LB 985" /LENGTH=153 /DNA_ID=CAMNT_0015907043 /DNA_START=46 /DNA_END=507 /DNA_ORIENTATION=+
MTVARIGVAHAGAPRSGVVDLLPTRAQTSPVAVSFPTATGITTPADDSLRLAVVGALMSVPLVRVSKKGGSGAVQYEAGVRLLLSRTAALRQRHRSGVEPPSPLTATSAFENQTLRYSSVHSIADSIADSSVAQANLKVEVECIAQLLSPLPR